MAHSFRASKLWDGRIKDGEELKAAPFAPSIFTCQIAWQMVAFTN
jgi:hypothetical protein